jgi:hypothetical protein
MNKHLMGGSEAGSLSRCWQSSAHRRAAWAAGTNINRVKPNHTANIPLARIGIPQKRIVSFPKNDRHTRPRANLHYHVARGHDNKKSGGRRLPLRRSAGIEVSQQAVEFGASTDDE